MTAGCSTSYRGMLAGDGVGHHPLLAQAVGPVVAFARRCKRFRRRAVRPIKLREGDYLTDLRDDFTRCWKSSKSEASTCQARRSRSARRRCQENRINRTFIPGLPP